MTIKLRPYQEEALAALQEAEDRGQRRNMIVMATGLGKTVVFGKLTADTPGRTLILAHRDELINQAVDKLLQVEPRLHLGVVKAERDDRWNQVVVASVQTLARERRRERLFQTPDFSRVICDEAHHSVANSYRAVFEDAGCYNPDGPLLLGVTATPQRGDKVGLDAIFEGIVYERDILWGIQNGYLCDLRGKQIYMDLDLDQVRTTAGDFQDGALGEAMEEADAPEIIAAAYYREAPGRKAIVFTPTVNVAKLTSAALKRLGVGAEWVSGTTPEGERRAMLKRFASGATMVICNCAVLTEGFDEPSVDCIVVARPTKSAAFFIQMVGRGTRTFMNKTDCLILDMVGNTSRHKLVTLSTLFGKPLSALKDGSKSVTAALQEEEEREARANGIQFRARDVDLFGRAQFHWVRLPQGWSLSGAGGMRYYLTSPDPDADQWSLVAQKQGHADNVILKGVDLGYAQGAAEDALRASGQTVLADPGARWRKDPPSDKQIKTLVKLGVAIPEQLTKGEASDLLERAFVIERSRRG